MSGSNGNNHRVNFARSSFYDHRRMEEEDAFEHDEDGFQIIEDHQQQSESSSWLRQPREVDNSLELEKSKALDLEGGSGKKDRRMTKHGQKVLEEMTVNKLKLDQLMAVGGADLIGREREKMILLDCLKRVCANQGDNSSGVDAFTSTTSDRSKGIKQRHSELVLIRGLSGTGKTVLAHTLKKDVGAMRNPSAILVGGKFDVVTDDEDDSKPFSGLAMAFGKLCRQLADMHIAGQLEAHTLHSIREEILGELGERLYLMKHIIPGLEELLFPDPSMRASVLGNENGRRSSYSNAKTVIQQTTYAVQMFVRIINAHFAPLVIVLDDLQFADQASLDLIHALLSDHTVHYNRDEKKMRKTAFQMMSSKKGGLMIIGCYRTNDVFKGHRLEKAIKKLKSKAGSSINPFVDAHGSDKTAWSAALESTVFMTTIVTELEIGPLTASHTNRALMILLGIDDEKTTLSLAAICHKRTLGNPFFLIQFVIMLEREGMLHFHLGLMKWTWDEKDIEELTAATNNVVDMMELQMSRLPQDRLNFLKTTACLGSTFQLRIVCVAWNSMVKKTGEIYRESQVEKMLEMECEDGYMEKSGKTAYKFVHDKVQLAALDTMSASALSQVKALISTGLRKGLSDEELESELFLVTNLMNNGPLEFQEKCRFNMILMNLRAAEKAKKLAAFPASLRYCKAGIALLPEDCWSTGFVETLRLYSIGAEVTEYLGDSELMEKYCTIVSERKECSISDKLRVYNVLMDHFGNKGQTDKALQLGFTALKEFGFEFPKIAAVAKAQAMSKLRKLHSNPVSHEAIAKLSLLQNEEMIQKMRLLFRMAVYLYYAKETALSMFGACQAIEWTMHSGYCAYSPASFASASIMLLSEFGDFAVAAQYAENALGILKMLPAKQNLTEPRLSYTTSMCLAWTRPIQSLLNTLQHGYKVGMQLGDTESAAWCLAIHSQDSFIASRPLQTLEEDCRRYFVQMEELSRHIQASFTKCIWQLALNLSTETLNKPTSIAGEAYGFLDESEIWTQASSMALTSRQVEFLQIALYTFFGEFVKGADLAIDKGDKVLHDIPGVASNMTNIFYKGLCCFAAAQITYSKPVRYRMNAEHFRSVVHEWVKKGNPNVLHYDSLLQAEHYALKKNVKEASAQYEKAVIRAARAGYLQDAALANERYAQFLLHVTDDREGGKYRVQEALRYYGDWGANTKVKALQESHKELLSL